MSVRCLTIARLLKNFWLFISLSVITRLCLLCFAAIPANEAIKKRVLAHWWVGEGFVNPTVDGEKTVEEIADRIFEELTKKGCIEPVHKKWRSVVHSFKMHPLISSAVIVIAKEVGFLNFDDKGNPTANFSHSYRACLVNPSHLNIPNDLDPKMLQTIFNVNEFYRDCSKVDWSKLRNLKVLHLGRWHSRAEHHIEVDDIEFFKGLIHLTHLRIFSLQGISRIMELPDSVCKLLSLRILDLGACPNLGLLPETVGSLRNFTHLDMSECYLLERIPKGIALLSQLQVLKGFVVGHGHYKNDTSCTFHDLSALQKLRKLSINTSNVNFPSEEELIVLQKFGLLRKLTIAWGWNPPLDEHIKSDNVAAQPTTRSTVNSSGGDKIQYNAALEPATPTGTKKQMIRKSPTFKRVTRSTTMNQEHFRKLEKLDLQCYSQKTAPSWLRPGKLKGLKKLYIRGGLVKVQENDDKWAVETLRLKFVSELEMDWKEIPVSFPDLIYLEKCRCPRLTFFPCDESGVWLKP